MDGIISEEWVIENADKIDNWNSEIWHRLPDFSLEFIEQFSDEIGLQDYFCYLCACVSRSKQMKRIAHLVNINHESKTNNTPWEIAILSGNIEAVKFILEHNDSHNLKIARQWIKLRMYVVSGRHYTIKDKKAFRKYKNCLSFLTKYESRKKCLKNTQKNGM